MGLDTTHDCWHGPYGSFNAWRTRLCVAAGYGLFSAHEGFGGDKPWPGGDPLVKLLLHSDCDGSIATADCAAIADRLESLLPAIEDDSLGYYREKTEVFINGLRVAAERGEDVEFY